MRAGYFLMSNDITTAEFYMILLLMIPEVVEEKVRLPAVMPMAWGAKFVTMISKILPISSSDSLSV
jgi:hypothetical protein